jgi:hypothetical protein
MIKGAYAPFVFLFDYREWMMEKICLIVENKNALLRPSRAE